MGTILSLSSPRLSYASRRRSQRSVDDLSLDQFVVDARHRHGSTVSIAAGSHHGATGSGQGRGARGGGGGGGRRQSVGETPPQSGHHHHRQRWHDPKHAPPPRAPRP